VPRNPGHAPIPAHLAPFAAPANASGSSLQRIYDTAPIGLAFLSPDCRYLQINQRLTEICGISVEDHLGRTVRECVPALADSVEAIVSTMMATHEPVTGIEVAGQRADDAEQRSWITYWHPVHGPDDEIIGINVAAEEITERKRAEAALRASEQQFRTLSDSMPQLVWMGEADGSIFWFNSQLPDFAVVPAEAIAGQDWLAALAPDTSPEPWLECLAAGRPFEMELELFGKDESWRPFLTRIIPLRDPEGNLYRWIGTHIDISEQKRREAHIQFIAEELSHRSKNLLAVIMAIANQTARHARSVGQYHARFAERLAALFQSHELLVRDRWLGAPFSDLIAMQLKPFAEVGRGRVDMAGPPLTLRPQAVQYLGLAVHELATNASKHGALSDMRGHISIQWLVDAASDTVQLSWRERDGPIVVPPQRRGFGHVVIEQIVPRALSGTGALDFAPEGVSWTFEFPIQECESSSKVSLADLK
jgi:PAS domain S-box-containing protein